MTQHILVTGGRHYADRGRVRSLLSLYRHLAALDGETLIVHHGDCPTGADRLADEWAVENCVEVVRHPADWDRFGENAGPIRNGEMVREVARYGWSFVLHFPGGRGTADCVTQAEEYGLKVIDGAR